MFLSKLLNSLFKNGIICFVIFKLVLVICIVKDCLFFLFGCFLIKFFFLSIFNILVKVDWFFFESFVKSFWFILFCLDRFNKIIYCLVVRLNFFKLLLI